MDIYAFAPGETVLLAEAINATGGVDVLAGTSHGGFLAPKGWHDANLWDVYWTGREGCYRAFSQRLKPGQMVSCTPGSQAITQKAQLVLTMRETFGAAAPLFLPRSYLLPWDYLAFARAVRAGGAARPWVLKEDVHRGKGVAVLPPAAALRAARERKASASRHNAEPRALRYVVAQSHLFDGGVVVFGSEQGGAGDATAGASAQDMVVNLWQQDRGAAKPWSLGQLRAHLDASRGAGAGDRVWRRLRTGTAAALAAALPHQRERAAMLPGYQGGNVEVLGVDFLLDRHLVPHLVEVNWLPSMARKVVDGSGQDAGEAAAPEPFDVQKQQFMAAMLRVLRASHKAAEDGQAEARRPRGLQAGHWLALRALRREARAARGSFADLTRDVYEALACLQADTDAALDSCPWIAERREDLAVDRAPAPADAQGDDTGLAPKLGPLVRVLEALPRFHWGAPRLLRKEPVTTRTRPAALGPVEALTLELTRRADSLIHRGTELGYEAAIEAEWTRLARQRRTEL
ncbi:hypothetical protein QBZ16_004818 [Prototheca wickerhamii]|uniref:Tubulin--tyrosine ligase-like protein 5 n=1 Tax=Prototheca wickerhamii TaxID=3111 RepID=A0AAD9IHE5_PROWI|nr:hypothetical protein QBZ16_004818 [Prototheca wickerhamii]